RKFHQRQIADRLDADDKIADDAADQHTAQDHVETVIAQKQKRRLRAGVYFAEDAEQHPPQQSAQGAENGIEVDATEESHGSGIRRQGSGVNQQSRVRRLTTNPYPRL